MASSVEERLPLAREMTPTRRATLQVATIFAASCWGFTGHEG